MRAGYILLVSKLRLQRQLCKALCQGLQCEVSLPTGNDNFCPGGCGGVQAIKLILHIHPVRLHVQVLSAKKNDVTVLLHVIRLVSTRA